ncbi:uncharacterized protein LOC124887054 [Capsicum annuum]|uniref:uncharacterized protein LOC124887054 n=1 Tax=Capsicum annuum TaxID=4072 RepID=UPI001FB0BE19|nr:uncharacterized protein LOC124887054 [Capsicum annuum]
MEEKLKSRGDWNSRECVDNMWEMTVSCITETAREVLGVLKGRSGKHRGNWWKNKEVKRKGDKGSVLGGLEISDEGCYYSSYRCMEVEKVKGAIRRMQRGRATGLDEIPVDFWKSTSWAAIACEEIHVFDKQKNQWHITKIPPLGLPFNLNLRILRIHSQAQKFITIISSIFIHQIIKELIILILLLHSYTDSWSVHELTLKWYLSASWLCSSHFYTIFLLLFERVPDCNYQSKVSIGCTWVLKIKCHASREVERYKARLVPKDYSQQKGPDFAETFSPVAKIITVPEGFSRQGEYSGVGVSVCKLHKSLYGLKQAPIQWNLKLTEAIIAIVFTHLTMIILYLCRM